MYEADWTLTLKLDRRGPFTQCPISSYQYQQSALVGRLGKDQEQMKPTIPIV